MTTTYYFLLLGKKNGTGTTPSSAWTLTARDIVGDTELITAQTMTAITGMTGAYKYAYVGVDGLMLLGKATTTDTTMDETELAVVPETSQVIFTNLNGTISGLGARLPVALTSNGNMKSSLLEIITTALSEGAAGRIAAAWQGFFNVTGPLATAQGVNQTGDAFARLGAPAGASIAADIAALVAANWNRLTSALTTSGSIGKLIVDYLNATISSRATPADVTVSLAVSATQAATVATGRLAIVAGYTFRQTITSTSMDDLSAATKLWLSIKLSGSLADSASQIFIEKNGGLTVVAGAAYTTIAHGSLTVGGSAGAWTIDIYIHDIATALLFGIGSDLRVAGLKYTKAGAAADDLSAWDGSAVITDGIVRAVS